MRLIITFNNKNWELPEPWSPRYKTNAYILFPENEYNTYFTSDVLLKNTYDIEIKIKTPSSNNGYWRQIVGAFYGNNMYEGGFNLSMNGNNRYLGHGPWADSWYAEDEFIPIDLDTIYKIKINVGTNIAVVNDTNTYDGHGTNISRTLNVPMTIGNIIIGSFSDGTFNGKIYYIKVTEGLNLIAYYLASLINNTPTFINLVNDYVCTKNGTGTTTYGED